MYLFRFYPLKLFLINSNKGCFWMPNNRQILNNVKKINSNKGCFWIAVSNLVYKVAIWINSNKGCFWILADFQVFQVACKINSNKGCFWIDLQEYDSPFFLWLTVTKVVFESKNPLSLDMGSMSIFVLWWCLWWLSVQMRLMIWKMT